MSILNKDILLLLFDELHDNSKFLFSCLMVNRFWCETVIPILWKNPWRYAINYHKKISLYTIITSYLSDDIKKFLKKEGLGIQISSHPLIFDYLAFCRSIDIKIIDDIISIGSSTDYYRFLLQEEVYSFLIRKCPEIKYLNMCGTYDIINLPEAKTRLESLCELTCDTWIDSKYFYRLAHVCQQIQRIIIINKNYEINHGTTKLIELQKNLKYFKWVDEFNEEECYMDLLEDPYSDIFYILKKHVNTLDHFEICLQYDYGHLSDYYTIYDIHDYTFLQYSLLELSNLKIIEIHSPIFLNNDDFNEELEMVAYRELETLKIDFIDIYQVTCIIKNSFFLKELWIDEYNWDYDRFSDDTLNFLRTIGENCLLIEYLSIPVFSLLDNHFIEFEKLLKRCQNLRSLYFKETCECEEGKRLRYGDYLSNVLTRDAPISLKDIGIPYDARFSLQTLETFFEKWRGRPAISINMGAPYFYRRNDLYMELINKYKNEGVIKYINV
jgi:hypothetical protein